jgi:hypothetical protein
MKFDVLYNKLKFKAYVESETTPGVFYKVETDENGEFCCSCKGFGFKCTCKHIKNIVKELNL